jgi:hypothetical protein
MYLVRIAFMAVVGALVSTIIEHAFLPPTVNHWFYTLHYGWGMLVGWGLTAAMVENNKSHE